MLILLLVSSYSLSWLSLWPSVLSYLFCSIKLNVHTSCHKPFQKKSPKIQTNKMQMVIAIFRKKQSMKMLYRLYKAVHADSCDAKLPIFNPKLPFQDACFPHNSCRKRTDAQIPKETSSFGLSLTLSSGLSKRPSKEQRIAFKAHLSSPIKDTIM